MARGSGAALRTRLEPVRFLGCAALVAVGLSLASGTVTAQSAGPAAVAPAAQEARPLLPTPREYAPGEAIPLERGVAIMPAGHSEDGLTVQDLKEALGSRDVDADVRRGEAAVVVRLLRNADPEADRILDRTGLSLDPAMEEEGYVLVVEEGRADVVASTAAGIYYGVQTLKQLLEGRGVDARLHGARIRDWPALRWRGLHDDLSRGPVPTLEFQKEQIRTLAAYKLNVYSPYFEHTLAYESHPLIAPPGGAMTAEQVRELVEFARRHHVTVVPEQEAFGHLHHVLKWELYQDAAETPHGHVLAPGRDESLELIEDWFSEIFSLFPGPFVHLGADETFDLGRGRTRERVEEEGLGPVYVEFLTRIVELLEPSGKRFLFWGDVAVNEPELVSELPPELIAVAWNYWSSDGFDDYLNTFESVGMETWVAPGVNNWSRIYPDFHVALPNIRGFVAAGQRLGSTGMLNTTWDDDGEALFNQTWYGVVFGAQAAWRDGPAEIDTFRESFGAVFHEDPTGRVAEAYRLLTEAYRLLHGADVGAGTDVLFWMDPWSEEGQRVSAELLPTASELRLAAERAIVALAEGRREAAARGDTLGHPEVMAAMELGARKMDFIGLKFQLAREIVESYDRAARIAARGERVDDAELRRAVTDELRDISAINGRMQDLRNGYGVLRQLYEDAWYRENRPYWIHNVLARYDRGVQRWTDRIDAFGAVWSRWRREGTIPPAVEAGIPALRP